MPVRTYLSPEELQTAVAKIAPITASFDNLPVHIAITDVHANVLYANKEAMKKTGYLDGAEVLGHNPGDLWGGQMDEAFFTQMWQTIKVEKKPFAGKLKNIRKDGAEYWVVLQIQPIFDKQNELAYFFAIEPEVTQGSLTNDDVQRAIASFQTFVKALAV